MKVKQRGSSGYFKSILFLKLFFTFIVTKGYHRFSYFGRRCGSPVPQVPQAILPASTGLPQTILP